PCPRARQRRWRNRGNLRRPRPGPRVRKRVVHHLARPRADCARARRAVARAADALHRAEEPRIRWPAGAAASADQEVNGVGIHFTSCHSSIRKRRYGITHRLEAYFRVMTDLLSPDLSRRRFLATGLAAAGLAVGSDAVAATTARAQRAAATFPKSFLWGAA